MGASFWSYVVPYEADVHAAFAELQARVLKKAHGGKSLAKVQRAAGEDGTHSIIDMTKASVEEAPPALRPGSMFTTTADGHALVADAFMQHHQQTYGTVFRMSAAEISQVFGDAKPSRAAAESVYPAFKFIERGTGRHTVLYVDDAPAWLWFFGVSGD